MQSRRNKSQKGKKREIIMESKPEKILLANVTGVSRAVIGQISFECAFILSEI